MKKPSLSLSLFLIAGLAACSGANNSAGVTPQGISGGAARHAASSSPIQHIVVIVQQGRSFDNLFHDFPDANGATSGQGHNGQTYRLKATPLASKYGLGTTHYQFAVDYDSAKNDGFDRQVVGNNHSSSQCAGPGWINYPSCYKVAESKVPYSYVERGDIRQYWKMANQYVLGDNTFASNSGPAFPSLQYMIAGESAHASENPDAMQWGCPDPKESVYYLGSNGEQLGPDPCFPLQQSGSYPTIANELDDAGITWRYYVESGRHAGSELNAYAAVNGIYNGPDWKKDISSPNANVLRDISAGNLQQVSWVMPAANESDRSGPQSGNLGPAWVASIVDAVGQSQYWKNTAIVIVWSDWGGWYDQVPPKQFRDPQTGISEGLGFRVPLIVVSPYAKAHYISHQQHEIASAAHFIEQTFGLPFLGSGSGQNYADQRADAFDDCFDFTQQPIHFKPIAK